MTGFKTDSFGKWIEKGPSAILDYSFDWSDWLQAGETITTSAWTATSGVTITDSGNSSTTTTVWLAGGTVSREYVITNRITTSGGRQDERSFRVIVQKR